MKKSVPILLAALTAGACDGVAQATPNLDLLFVANEGVLVQTATKKVLIDALFTDPNPEYAAPPSEVLELMFGGREPFDDVNLVLVTHDHPDHFEARAVGRFLSDNPQAVLVAPEDAVRAMQDIFPSWTSIRDRVVSVALEPGHSQRNGFDGITITAYRTLHSGQREEPQNLMYLIEMEGRTVFHEGDSDGNPETFMNFGLGEEQIDLALVHFWFPMDPDAEEILRGILKADHVGLFHLPNRLQDDAPGTIAQVAVNYPDMFLLLNSGDRRTLPE